MLRDSVVENFNFEGSSRILFHIDEAMSWETVRHLETMKPMLILIRNLAVQGNAEKEVIRNIEDVAEILDEVLTSHNTGKL